MRNYFCFDLRGRDLLLPFLAGWLVILATSFFFGWIMEPYAVSDPVLDWHYATGILCSMLFFFVILFAALFVLYYFVKGSIGGISLSGERLETDFELRPYLFLCLRDAALSIVTFGIYIPWLVADVMRYFASGTSFRFNALEFRGRGTTLFIYMALFAVAPVFILWSVTLAVYSSAGYLSPGALLSVGLLGLAVMLAGAVYRAWSIKWFINFAYGGRKRIVSGAHGWDAGLFLFGQGILIILTLGLYYPMALIRIWRYYVQRLVLGEETVEDTFGFAMRPWRNYLFVLGQMVLAVITAGIYYPWAYAKILRLLVSQTYVEPADFRTAASMPEDYR